MLISELPWQQEDTQHSCRLGVPFGVLSWPHSALWPSSARNVHHQSQPLGCGGSLVSETTRGPSGGSNGGADWPQFIESVAPSCKTILSSFWWPHFRPVAVNQTRPARAPNKAKLITGIQSDGRPSARPAVQMGANCSSRKVRLAGALGPPKLARTADKQRRFLIPFHLAQLATWWPQVALCSAVCAHLGPFALNWPPVVWRKLINFCLFAKSAYQQIKWRRSGRERESLEPILVAHAPEAVFGRPHLALIGPNEPILGIDFVHWAEIVVERKMAFTWYLFSAPQEQEFSRATLFGRETLWAQNSLEETLFGRKTLQSSGPKLAPLVAPHNTPDLRSTWRAFEKRQRWEGERKQRKGVQSASLLVQRSGPTFAPADEYWRPSCVHQKAQRAGGH